MNLAADFRTLLIALWLGAALFFSFAVAQSTFAVLPSRDLAGALVNRTLAIINYSGLIVGLVLLLTSFVSRQNVNRTKLWIEQAALLLLTAACTFGQLVIAARLHALRQQIGRPVDELAAGDPLRVEFGSLHGYSVMVLGIALIAAVIAFFMIAKRARNNEYR